MIHVSVLTTLMRKIVLPTFADKFSSVWGDCAELQPDIHLSSLRLNLICSVHKSMSVCSILSIFGAAIFKQSGTLHRIELRFQHIHTLC